jgi:hypothetical protein
MLTYAGWQARKEMIVMQKEQLELAIESNMLTPEQYLSQVKAAMQGAMLLVCGVCWRMLAFAGVC